MRRYPSIKTRYMINCQTMIKMMLKRDKESVVGKLNPAGYPLIKIVVLVSYLLHKSVNTSRGREGSSTFKFKTMNDRTGCWHLGKLCPKMENWVTI